MEASTNDTARCFCKVSIAWVILCTLSVSPKVLHSQSIEKHVALGITSDWTHHHVLYPYSNSYSVMARVQKDPRWVHDWYTRHPDAWWPNVRFEPYKSAKGSQRDWSYSVGTTSFEPLFDFSFSIGSQTGNGSLNVSDQSNGQYLAIAGSVTVNGIYDVGTYPLYPGGPGAIDSPSGAFIYDNLLFPSYPSTNPSIDVDGLLFRNSSGFEVNIWGNGPNAYEYDDTGYAHDNTGAPLNLSIDPGGGQTFPDKFVFDVTATPSCTNDLLAMGIPSNPEAGGQANIICLDNLYTLQRARSHRLLSGNRTSREVRLRLRNGTGTSQRNSLLGRRTDCLYRDFANRQFLFSCPDDWYDGQQRIQRDSSCGPRIRE
jgi:hypothetical protein